jgi:hypothetical protein
LVLVAATATLASAAEWTGFWGGGVPELEEVFPGISEVMPGRWTNAPVCWAFDNGVRAWTDAEEGVARTAIELWNNIDVLFGEPNVLQGQLFEASDASCENNPADILLRWEDATTVFTDIGDANGDGMETNFTDSIGDFIAVQYTPQFQFEPCPDFVEASVLPRCSVVILNADLAVDWFSDPTPELNEEFRTVDAEFCGQPSTTLKPAGGSSAEGKLDFFTIFAHQFGHALGLLNAFGCDGSPFTQEPEDDDGSVMFQNFSEGRRFP